MTMDRLLELSLNSIKQLGLSESTFTHYRGSGYIPVAKEYKRLFGDEAMADRLMDLQSAIIRDYRAHRISRDSKSMKARAINVMAEILETGTLEWRKYPARQEERLPPAEYAPVVDAFLSDSSKLKNMAFIKSVTIQYFWHLNDVFGSPKVSDIGFKHGESFIIQASRKYKKSMDGVLYVLRKIHSFLCSHGYSSDASWKLLGTANKREYYVRPVMEKQDIMSVIKCAGGDDGKRDRAILLLIAVTGLRCCDISSLRLEDIEWKKHYLSLIQQKTEAPVSIPVSKKVLDVLADYVINARPEGQFPQVFLSARNPTRPLSPSAVYSLLRRRLKRAGIEKMPGDGRSPHGMRRSLATAMVSSGAEVAIVSQILGHRSMNSARHYISSDMKGLSKCVLDMGSLMEEG